MSKTKTHIPPRAKTRPFFVDFKAGIRENVEVHMEKLVHATDNENAIEVCQKQVATDYDRTIWCMPFQALSVKEAQTEE